MMAGISAGGVHSSIKDVTEAIIKHVRSVRWPSEENKMHNKLYFERLGFAGAIGCVDCSYTYFRKSSRSRTDYGHRGRFGQYHQVVCGPDLRIYQYTIGVPGSFPDSRIYHMSQVYKLRSDLFSEGEYLLADSGYGLRDTTLTPFSKRSKDYETGDQFVKKLVRAFNRNHAQARSVVERVFGALKCRFPRLSLVNDDTERCKSSLEAIMRIHNYLLDCVEDFDGLANGYELYPDGNGRDVTSELWNHSGETECPFPNNRLKEFQKRIGTQYQIQALISVGRLHGISSSTN